MHERQYWTYSYIFIYIMSLSSNNRNIYKNQYKAAYFSNPANTMVKEETESAFKIAEKQYIRQHGKTFQKESILLMMKRDIFESALKKMELAVALPSIILDPTLSTILTVDEMNVINNILLFDSEFSKNLSNQSVSTKDSMTYANYKTYDKSKFEHAICRALKILQKYTNTLYARPRYKRISEASVLFLQRIRYFLEQYIQDRMYVTPEEARNKELHYRKLWHCRKKCIEDVATINANLKKQEIEHKKEIEDVVKQYEKNIDTIEEINTRCNEDLVDITTRYEMKQLNLCKEWEQEQREIQNGLDYTIDNLKSLKSTNTNLEQAIQKRRWKTISRLTGVVDKYDVEIGGRYQMMEEMDQIYKDDKIEKHALEKELAQQEKMLTVCVEQKEVAKKKLSKFV